MNLSQLILFELNNQHSSYDKLAERAYARGQGVTASYLCILVNRALKGLRENTIKCVAAALSPTDDQVPAYEERVAAACMESWGYDVHRLVGAQPEQPAMLRGECVVISTKGLTTKQALEVQARALEIMEQMEAINNGAGDLNQSSRTTRSNVLPHPREQPGHGDRGRHRVGRKSATDRSTRTRRSQAAS